jgi:hypothetical protein
VPWHLSVLDLRRASPCSKASPSMLSTSKESMPAAAGGCAVHVPIRQQLHGGKSSTSVCLGGAGRGGQGPTAPCL